LPRFGTPEHDAVLATLGSPEDRAVAVAMCHEGVTLLQNAQSVLPLPLNKPIPGGDPCAHASLFLLVLM